MPCAQGVFVDLRAGRRLADAAYGERLPDVVDLTDEREDGTGDLGEAHCPVVDDETATDHAVVSDELAQHLGDGRSGPRHPPLGVEEPALRFSRQQRFPVVELEQEVDARAHGLDRIEQLESGARHPSRDREAVEDVVREEVRGVGRDDLRNPEGRAARVSTGLPKVIRLAMPRLRRYAAT